MADATAADTPEAKASGCAKLALGTVQWGMRYGITGRGQPDSREVGAILAAARTAGVSMLDTAYAYGSAEQVIGELNAATRTFDIVTKPLPVRAESIDAAHCAAVEAALEDSARRLRRDTVYALLVHNADNLLLPGAERLWALLERHRAAGKVGRIGVSVYSPEQCAAILERFPIEIVQLPFNIYDQRFLTSGALADLKARGVEIHARSAFLQGLLLMAPTDLPPHFAAIREHHAALGALFAAQGISPLAGALHFCLEQPLLDRIVVGCETAEQFGEIRAAATGPAPAVLYSDFAVSDPAILEPSRWPK